MSTVPRWWEKIDLDRIGNAGRITLNAGARDAVLKAMADFRLAVTPGAAAQGKAQPMPEAERKPVRESYESVAAAFGRAADALREAAEAMDAAPAVVCRDAHDTMAWYIDVLRDWGDGQVLREHLGPEEYGRIMLEVASGLVSPADFRDLPEKMRPPPSAEERFEKAHTPSRRGQIGFPAFIAFVRDLHSIYRQAGGIEPIVQHKYGPHVAPDGTWRDRPRFSGTPMDFIIAASEEIEAMLPAGAMPDHSASVFYRDNLIGKALSPSRSRGNPK